MIKADIITLQNDSFLVAWIYPEPQLNKSLIHTPSQSIFDIKRRLQSVTRTYVIVVLTKWINQRAKVRPDQIHTIANIREAFRKLQNQLPYKLFDYLQLKRGDFESLAPSKETSQCMPYYKDKILPLLNLTIEQLEKDDHLLFHN